MADDFDQHLKNCMEKLSNTVMTGNISVNSKNSAILKTKFDLGGICHDKAIEYFSKKDK